MKNKATKPKVHIELTAFWGNGDAESTIKVSQRRWKQIQEGAEYETSARSWYEGERYDVSWHFSNSEVSIDGDDGAEHVINCPVEELLVQTNASK
jgi:hypothetical protein